MKSKINLPFSDPIDDLGMIELDDLETTHVQVGIDIAEHFPGKELVGREPEVVGIVRWGKNLDRRIEHRVRSLRVLEA
jgi:hypothetical protein